MMPDRRNTDGRIKFHHSVGSGTVVIGVSRDDSERVFCGILRYHWFRTGAVTFVRHRIIGFGTFLLGVLGCGVVFDTLVWRSGTWFIMGGD